MRIYAKAASTFCAKVLEAAGIPGDHAAIVADNLVTADLRGIDSHGISRLYVYCQRIKSGMINKHPQVRAVKETAATLHIDGDNGLGAVIGTKAMELTIQKAAVSGTAISTVKNGNHFGIAAYYAMKALEHDMIGITLSNAPPTMAPWGSITPLLGTNPFCIAVPAGTHRPIVLDCATSVVARGKINLAQIENRPIPLGWAMDKEGRPTTDATQALNGLVLPFGTYKGSGISLIIDVLCGVLSGAAYGSHIGNLYDNDQTYQDLGFFFGAIDIKSFCEPEVFKARIDDMIDEIKNSRKAADVDDIYIPGEIEFDNHEKNLKKGIAIGPGVFKDLELLRQEFGIDMNLHDYIIEEGNNR